MASSVSYSFGDFGTIQQVEASANSIEAQKWQRLSEDNDNYGSSLGLGSHSGKRVTHKTALQLSAFWACVQANAQALA